MLEWCLSTAERIFCLIWLENPAFKEQIWFLRLENAQIANLSLVFEIFRAQKCSKQRNKSLRLLEMLKKPVGNCRNNLSCSSQQHFNLTCVQNLTCICEQVCLLLKPILDIFFANGHIMLNTPVLVRSLQLSNLEPSQYLDGLGTLGAVGFKFSHFCFCARLELMSMI